MTAGQEDEQVLLEKFQYHPAAAHSSSVTGVGVGVGDGVGVGVGQYSARTLAMSHTPSPSLGEPPITDTPEHGALQLLRLNECPISCEAVKLNALAFAAATGELGLNLILCDIQKLPSLNDTASAKLPVSVGVTKK